MSFVAQIRIIVQTILFSAYLLARFFIALPFHGFRWLVSLTCGWFNPDLRKILSYSCHVGRDGRLLKAFNLLISFRVQGTLDLDEFSSRFLEKCIHAKDDKKGLEFPEFQERIVLHFGYPFWSKYIGFDIANHIKGTQCNDLDKEQEKIEHGLMNEEFEMNDVSPWKILIVNDPSHNSSCVLFKFHHSLGDGVSLYNALMRVTDRQVPLQPHGIPNSPWLSRQMKNLQSLLLPTTLVQDFLGNPTLEFLTLENMKSERYFVKSSKIPKQKLKDIQVKYNVPFTAVLLATLTGGIRDHLLRLKLPIPKDFLCTLPIRVPNHTPGLTNDMSVTYFKLPIGAASPKEQLHLCRLTLEDAARSQLPVYSTFDTFILNAYPVSMTSGFELPLALSFFPGPSSAISLNNGRNVVTDMCFYFHGEKQFGIKFTTLTYNGGLTMVMSANTSVFQTRKDAKIFMDSMEQHLQVLSEA